MSTTRINTTLDKQRNFDEPKIPTFGNILDICGDEFDEIRTKIIPINPNTAKLYRLMELGTDSDLTSNEWRAFRIHLSEFVNDENSNLNEFQQCRVYQRLNEFFATHSLPSIEELDYVDKISRRLAKSNHNEEIKIQCRP